MAVAGVLVLIDITGGGGRLPRPTEVGLDEAATDSPIPGIMGGGARDVALLSVVRR